VKRFLIFPIFLLGLFPISNVEASLNELQKDIKNWFRNDYWMYQKYSNILNTFCQVQKENSKNPQDIDCNSKKSAAKEQYDSDFHRKRKCEYFFETNFKIVELVEDIKVEEKIINDCRRIYKTYKNDKEFDIDGFSKKWDSFPLAKGDQYYEGNYLNGKKEGFGTLYFSNGDIYIGEFKQDKFHGKGYLSWISGDSYRGDFVDGKKHGKGTIKFMFSTWEGEFTDNWIRGKGIYTYKSKYKNVEVFDGYIYGSEGRGRGTLFYKDGSKYIGEVDYIPGSREDQGIYYGKNGQILSEGIWEFDKLIKSQKVNLKALMASNNEVKDSNKNSHEDCLKATDYQGCMNYKSGEVNTNKNNLDIGNFKNDNFKKTDCIEYVCRPEEALKYGTDNLGMAVIPGYSFIDDPAERTADYFGSPQKLNVNGSFGRYIYIPRIVRYYSDGRSGYINSIQGIGSNSSPTIIYRSGEAPGVRQTLIHNVFDCEDKTYARFNGNKSNRLMESTNKAGKFKKKWLSFDDVSPGFTFNRGKEACNKSKNYIMSLKASRFTKFEKKAPKSSLKKINSDVNCNSPVWEKRPICN